MKKKTVYLISSILSGLVFMGFLSESEPQQMFGLEINIWVLRLIWLFFAMSSFISYRKLSKENAE